MMEQYYALGALAVVAGYFAAEAMMRDSAIGEMRILLDDSGTEPLLASGWGAEEFPEFFGEKWDGGNREYYAMLSRKLGGARYGKSRGLLRGLIRIEDRRQDAKNGAGSAAGPDTYAENTRALLERYRGGDDFSGLLAAFISKRHSERVAAWK